MESRKVITYTVLTDQLVSQCYESIYLYFALLFQSNALPGHVKINITRENLFEDSFQQVRACVRA